MHEGDQSAAVTQTDVTQAQLSTDGRVLCVRTGTIEIPEPKEKLESALWLSILRYSNAVATIILFSAFNVKTVVQLCPYPFNCFNLITNEYNIYFYRDTYWEQQEEMHCPICTGQVLHNCVYKIVYNILLCELRKSCILNTRGNVRLYNMYWTSVHKSPICLYSWKERSERTISLENFFPKEQLSLFS